MGIRGTATGLPLTELFRGDKCSMASIEGITVAWSAIADRTSIARGGNPGSGHPWPVAEFGGDRQFEKILEVAEADDGTWAELPCDRGDDQAGRSR